MDSGLDFATLELSTQTSEPYVPAWPLGDGIDGDAECSAMAIMKREGGVLLVLPGAFLPPEVVDQGNSGFEGAVFGPSLRCEVPGNILDGGSVHPTSSIMSVLVVDCLPEVTSRLRSFAADEEIYSGFDDESPFALPALDALLPAVKRWLAEVPDLGAFYTPTRWSLRRRTSSIPRQDTCGGVAKVLPADCNAFRATDHDGKSPSTCGASSLAQSLAMPRSATLGAWQNLWALLQGLLRLRPMVFWLSCKIIALPIFRL